MSADLFEPLQLGDLTRASRMVTAPMTRDRADENGVLPQAHLGYFVAQPGLRGSACAHGPDRDMTTMSSAPDDRAVRAKFAGPYIANRGYDVRRAQTAARSVTVDPAPFGLPVLANPDPVRRCRENLPLNAAEPSTLCGGGEAGCPDCPIYRGEETQAARPAKRGWAGR